MYVLAQALIPFAAIGLVLLAGKLTGRLEHRK
jgi:hypothetical protein